MPNDSGDLRHEDAPGALGLALAHTRAGAEAIRRGGGIFATTQLASEIEALRRFADEPGLLHDFGLLNAAPDAFGFEHEVWFPASGTVPSRVMKATYGNAFGTLPDGGEASPMGYLARLMLQNEVFGDDIRLEGVWEARPGVIRVVTSQPAIAGRSAEPEEIRTFFESSGFTLGRWRRNAVWFRPDDDILCSDTHGGNILMTHDGMLVAIDVPIMLAPAGFALA
jgi:hypothetical protein